MKKNTRGCNNEENEVKIEVKIDVGKLRGDWGRDGPASPHARPTFFTRCKSKRSQKPEQIAEGYIDAAVLYAVARTPPATGLQ